MILYSLVVARWGFEVVVCLAGAVVFYTSLAVLQYQDGSYDLCRPGSWIKTVQRLFHMQGPRDITLAISRGTSHNLWAILYAYFVGVCGCRLPPGDPSVLIQ